MFTIDRNVIAEADSQVIQKELNVEGKYKIMSIRKDGILIADFYEDADRKYVQKVVVFLNSLERE